MATDDERGARDDSPGTSSARAPAGAKKPYEPPRVLTDEAFEQIALSCSMKMTTKKNFT